MLNFLTYDFTHTVKDIPTGHLDQTIVYIYPSVIEEFKMHGVTFPLLQNDCPINSVLTYCAKSSKFAGMWRFELPVSVEKHSVMKEINAYMRFIKHTFGDASCWGFMRIEGKEPVEV